MAEDKLPPMPPSDPGSLERNTYDHFYQVSSRGFWKNNEINYIKDEWKEPCQHYFEQKGADVICKHCHFGLETSIGLITKEGKLYHNDEEIKFKTQIVAL